MITPPIEPMLAAPIGHAVPESSTGVAFEPKWDGFRCLVFRSDDDVVLQGRGRSRSTADEFIDLSYAFPELVAECLDQLPPGTVIDGEIVVINDGRLDFVTLTSRLRPRSEAGGPSIQRLATAYPAQLLAFDVLFRGADLRALPFLERRGELERLAATWHEPLLLTPSTQDVHVARRWFEDFESAGVDGLIVKNLDDPYLSGKRLQGKIKHQRTADVVVAGWRPHSKPGADGRPVLGSLLLGLWDGDVLHYVGVASAFSAKKRAELVELMQPLEVADDQHPWRGAPQGRIPGEASRWKKEQPWIAVRPELVAEVTYDQMEQNRFRHVASFVRWRPDRTSDSCTYEQLDELTRASIADLFITSG